jgi:hypothetical protein
VPATLAAQGRPAPRWLDPAAHQVAAFTLCADGRPVTFVNAGVIESDSLAEILAHERRHLEQLRSRRACDAPAAEPEPMESLLADEIDGYCASLPYAEQRGIPRGERIGQYAGRLFRQFGGLIPVGAIAARLQTCADTL